ncbi:MAG: GGDEF domain-containing protein [Phycisphaerae bacterium]
MAENRIAEDLAARIGRGSELRHIADPFQALEELAAQSWPVVVLAQTAGDDFAALCRACRRLQPDARIIALCPPAMEPEVCPLSGDVLDDYFIYPPTRSELASLVQPPAASPTPTPSRESSPASPPQTLSGLSLEDHSRLVGATFSRNDLEACIAQMLAGRVHQRLEWADAAEPPAGATVLLEARDTPPRLLLAEGAVEDAVAKAFLASLADFLPALWSAAKRTETLHHLAITDHLTGAYNRRYFYHAADAVLKQAAAEGQRVTVLLYDIDDFKTYNDRYGYAAGDEILCETALLMQQITRAHDVVARIGGDEFAVLFWDKEPPRKSDSKPPEDAAAIANRFLKALQQLQFPSLGPNAQGTLTISGGLASFPADGTTCRDLLRKADLALKQVKQSGKAAIRLVGR